jgi:hypothetical protein
VQHRPDRRENCNVPYWLHEAPFLSLIGIKGVPMKRL